MKAPIKKEQQVTIFNGVDVTQTQEYIKIHCTAYLERMLERHSWMKDIPSTNETLPMSSDPEFIRKIDSTEGSDDPKQIQLLEDEFGFKYRSATGGLIFAIITARPDISYPTVKLCQYNSCPVRVHFEAIKRILLYIRDTTNDGIYFWRTRPHPTLKKGPRPTPRSEEYNPKIPSAAQDPTKVHAFADSDWAGDSKNRRSVSGIGIMFAGSVIIYKTMFQKSIALSSTEAEFYALCETGKMTLYVRSILDELGISQLAATQVFEDNEGCLNLVNSSQPTRRTRHIEIREFAIQDWIKGDLLNVFI